MVAEGESLERLRERAAAVLPKLLEDNAAQFPAERREGPHSPPIVVFHESTVAVAA
jgi:hypothetical protein